MKRIQLKIKKLVSVAEMPRYATPGAAGMDVTAVAREMDEYGNIVYHTGLAMEVPEGYAAKFYARSSVSKTDLSLANCVGIIDSDYRGEVVLKFRRHKGENTVYDVGDRVAQMIIEERPQVECVWVDELTTTERGNGGFGSTGC